MSEETGAGAVYKGMLNLIENIIQTPPKITKKKLSYPTQRERLLAYLYKNKGKRSSDWDIVMEVRTLQYSARIRELRKLGYIIENMSKWGTNSLGEKVRYGYFRLVKDPTGARIN